MQLEAVSLELQAKLQVAREPASEQVSEQVSAQGLGAQVAARGAELARVPDRARTKFMEYWVP
jgi:hypothetical protein